MKKFAEIGMLLTIYGGLLTDRQRDVMDLYYNYDLTLSEIAEQLGISRQGVHDLIRRSEQILFNVEQSIGVIAFRERVMNEFNDIEQDIDGVIGQLDASDEQNINKLKEQLRQQLQGIKKKILEISSL